MRTSEETGMKLLKLFLYLILVFAPTMVLYKFWSSDVAVKYYMAATALHVVAFMGWLWSKAEAIVEEKKRSDNSKVDTEELL